MQKKKSSTRTKTQEERKDIYERELPKEILSELTEEQVQQYQIWDNISKRILQIYPRMIFPIIKEIFDEEYPENAKVVDTYVEYTVPVMKVQNYNLTMIHDKKLYAILPLTLLRFKKESKQKYKEKDIKELTEFIKKAILILEEAYKEGHISEIQKNDIVDYIFRSGRHLFRKDVEILRRINDEIPPFAKLSREIIEELKEDKEEGIKELILLEKEEHKSAEQCIQALKRIFRLTDDQAKEKMDLYWPE